LYCPFQTSVEVRALELAGQKIPWNFWRWNLWDEKFRGIPNAGDSRTKNSKEFRTLEPPGRKIPKNSGHWSLWDEKFQRIPDTELSGDEKINEISHYK
jgi:hypothetical protein